MEQSNHVACDGALSPGKIADAHSFSSAQMKCLEAIFDTFIPSISCESSAHIAPALPDNSEGWSKGNQDELQCFYELSASQAGVPSYAAGLMYSKLKPNVLQLASWVLWLLSSRVGTYLLCGRGSLCGKAPFFRSFTEIPLPEREKLLITAWSQSAYLFFRTVFNAFKIFAVYSYYSKVDKHGHNLAWKAIGYCGPDPAAIEHRRKAEKAARRPLEGSVFDAELLKEGLPLKLEEAGFEVLKDVTHLASLWNCKGLAEAKVKVGVKCDVVVVGSGSGGGVTAGVLAKAGYKVLVVEKGKYFARDDLSLLEGPTLDKMYEGGGILASDNNNVLLLAGATVGGGSAINWSASFKTPPHVLEEWVQDHGLTMFGDGQYEAAMQAVLARLAVQSDVGEENWQNGLLRKGCEKLGFHVADAPRNTVADHSCGWCGFGCWSGKKQATSETWLVDAAANGAAILTGVSAEAVLQRNATKGKQQRQAVGVVASVAGGAHLLFIESRITVVSCGSLNTPVLLQRSGLQNPHIGRNLHLHPVQMMWGYFPEAVHAQTAYEGGIITAVSREFADWRPRGHGCILQCPSLHPGVFAVLNPWLSAKDFKDRMRRFSRTAHVFALARDRGSGTVGSSQAGRTVHYPLHPLDHESLLDGGEAALRVLIAAGASEIGTHHRHGDRLVLTQDTSAADVDEFLRRVRSRGVEQLGTPLCSAHQMGSCRMGMDPSTSVVGPTGETWDVAGLFVADASVFPSAVGINPMITVQSVAYCISHAIMRALEQSC